MLILNDITFNVQEYNNDDNDFVITCNVLHTQQLKLNVDTSYDNEFEFALRTSITALMNVRVEFVERVCTIIGEFNLQDLLCKLLNQYIFMRIVDLTRIINFAHITDKQKLFTKLSINPQYQQNRDIFKFYQRCIRESLVCISMKNTFSNIYYANTIFNMNYKISSLKSSNALVIFHIWFADTKSIRKYIDIVKEHPITKAFKLYDIRRYIICDDNIFVNNINQARLHPLTIKQIKFYFNEEKRYKEYLKLVTETEQTDIIRFKFTLHNGQQVVDTDKLNIIRRLESELYREYIDSKFHSTIRCICSCSTV